MIIILLIRSGTLLKHINNNIEYAYCAHSKNKIGLQKWHG